MSETVKCSKCGTTNFGKPHRVFITYRPELPYLCEKCANAEGYFFIDIGADAADRERKLAEHGSLSARVAELEKQLADARASIDSLRPLAYRTEAAERFKQYVHERLDKAGVPHDPEPEINKATGCRIDGRLNWLIARAKVDGEVFNMGRHEGQADVGVQLRKLLDPTDANHWSIDGCFSEVRRLMALAKHPNDEALEKTLGKDAGANAKALVDSKYVSAKRTGELEDEVERLKRALAAAEARESELRRICQLALDFAATTPEEWNAVAKEIAHALSDKPPSEALDKLLADARAQALAEASAKWADEHQARTEADKLLNALSARVEKLTRFAPDFVTGLEVVPPYPDEALAALYEKTKADRDAFKKAAAEALRLGATKLADAEAKLRQVLRFVEAKVGFRPGGEVVDLVLVADLLRQLLLSTQGPSALRDLLKQLGQDVRDACGKLCVEAAHDLSPNVENIRAFVLTVPVQKIAALDLDAIVDRQLRGER